MGILRLTEIHIKKDNNMDIEEIEKIFKNMGLGNKKYRENIIKLSKSSPSETNNNKTTFVYANSNSIEEENAYNAKLESNIK